MSVLDDIFAEIPKDRANRKQSVVILNYACRVEITRDNRRFKVIRVKTKPKTIFGIPMFFDNNQKEPWRVVVR